MDVQDNSAANVTNPAGDKNAARWRPILPALCAVGAVLVIAILALQVTEYRFYKAAPNVWPQSGGGVAGAPVVPPASVVSTTPVAAPTNSTGMESATVSTNVSETAKP
ncbi:MAG: hypothetical protein WC381_02900 [Kiritimatiellia bacterium]|jgi:hypothetical protein